jgi:hypothetical protein
MDVGAQGSGELQYEVWFNDYLLAEGEVVPFSRAHPLSIDLADFAGQGGQLRLITKGRSGEPEGVWMQPRLLAQADWLLHSLPDEAQPAGHQFGEDVELLGYQVKPEPDGTVRVMLYWQAQRPLNKNATVFVHLLDESGTLLGQHDAAPVQNSYPFSVWPSGLIIADEHILPDPGTSFSLAVGLYNPDTLTRWPVINPDGTIDPDGRALLPVIGKQ